MEPARKSSPAWRLSKKFKKKGTLIHIRDSLEGLENSMSQSAATARIVILKQITYRKAKGTKIERKRKVSKHPY